MSIPHCRLLLALGAAAIVLLLAAGCLLLRPFAPAGEESYLYLDDDDTPDSLYCKLRSAQPQGRLGLLRLCCRLRGVERRVRAGRYLLTGRTESPSVLRLAQDLRNGHQAPVRLVVREDTRTAGQLAARLAGQLQADSAAWLACLEQTAVRRGLQAGAQAMLTLFLPNTYEVVWNVRPGRLVERMEAEADRFWQQQERETLRQQAGLTRSEVVTLASIVEQETAYEPEKPAVAGMYLNRLHQGMPLQADPTVKFAVGDFALRRITGEHLRQESPYNTYRHPGLPPAPICIPSLSSIDAVLHADRHPYIYMCAKEDFSGSHRFAQTYAEHQQNARRYQEALDRQGIK